MAAPTVATVNTLARSLLGDDEAAVYTDATLLPFINSAHRDLQVRLVNGGCRVLVTRATVDIPISFVQLTPASTPPLPTDFICAYKLWEKNQGALDSTYTRMIPQSELPDVAPTLQLGFWQAEAGGVNFVGATSIRTVRIEYERIVADFTAPGNPLPVLSSENALAHLAAALCASSRGTRDMANDEQALAESAIKQLSTRFTRANQVITGVRKNAYGRNGI